MTLKTLTESEQCNKSVRRSLIDWNYFYIIQQNKYKLFILPPEPSLWEMIELTNYSLKREKSYFNAQVMSEKTNFGFWLEYVMDYSLDNSYFTIYHGEILSCFCPCPSRSQRINSSQKPARVKQTLKTNSWWALKLAQPFHSNLIELLHVSLKRYKKKIKFEYL